MPALETPPPSRGIQAPDFHLPATDGKTYSLADVRGPKGTLIMFICNHCPFVRAIVDRIVRDAKELQALGVGVAAIMSNDVINYPEDSFEKMKAFAKEHRFTFPYLFDESQAIAQAYGAVCTPDFFGYNAEGKLEYRGRLDASRMEPMKGAKRDLYDAMIDIIKIGKGPSLQLPSMGCSIKWKNEAA